MVATQAIDHAGFSRNIVFRNPPRYDEEGMELDSDEDDKQADADAAERNPYHGVEIKGKSSAPRAVARINRNHRPPHATNLGFWSLESPRYEPRIHERGHHRHGQQNT